MYSMSFSHGIFNYSNISKIKIFFLCSGILQWESGQHHSYLSSTPLTLLSDTNASIPIENGNSVALYKHLTICIDFLMISLKDFLC